MALDLLPGYSRSSVCSVAVLRHSLIPISISLLVTLQPLQGVAEQSLDTSVCQIARHPSSWSGKLVRVRAGVHTVCIEGGYALFDAKCPKVIVLLDLAPNQSDPSRRTADAALEKIDAARCKVARSSSRGHHAEATVIGKVFYNTSLREADLFLVDASNIAIVAGPDPTR